MDSVLKHKNLGTNRMPLVVVISNADTEGWTGVADLVCPDFSVISLCDGCNLSEDLRAYMDILEFVLFDVNVSNDTIKKHLDNLTHLYEGVMVPFLMIGDRGAEFNQLLQENGWNAPYMPEVLTVGEARRAINDGIEEYQYVTELRRGVEQRSSAIGNILKGQFLIRTRREAQNLATMLCVGCSHAPTLAVGLTELLVNAVEHGCLEIGHERKGELIEAGVLSVEIKKRRAMMKYKNRSVVVDYKCENETVFFRIVDPGPGFDFSRFGDDMEIPTYRKNGRGILMARNAFDDLIFEGRGNIVAARRAQNPQQLCSKSPE